MSPVGVDASTARRGLGLGAVVAVLVVMMHGASWESVVLALVCSTLVMAALVDAVSGVLPNRILAVGSVVAVGGFSLVSVGVGSWDAWWRALFAASVALMVAVAVYVFTRGGLGEGDVKFVPLVFWPLGWSGWSAVFAGYLVSALVAAVSGIVASARAGRLRPVPFGPALATGAVVTVTFGLGWPP